MPQYLKGLGKGKLQRKRKWKGFESAHHMSRWLTRVRPSDKLWVKHFREPAKNYKKGKHFFHARSLRAVATKKPVQLAGDVLSELKKVQKGGQVGGGISELLHWFGREAAQLVGFNSFREWIGKGYEHKKLPKEAQVFAKAVSATYYEVDKRPNQVEDLVRIPEFDTDLFSVWKQPNGQFLVTIHGTKANWKDFGKDAAIAAGKSMKAPDSLQNLFEEFDKEGLQYDVAGHSLANQYIINSTHANADHIYLYNNPSSPMMKPEYLDEVANDKAYTQFINPSDALTSETWHNMNPETVNNSYIAPYTYSPFAAHSITAWYPDLDEPQEKAAGDG